MAKFLGVMTHARRFKLGVTAKNTNGTFVIMVITPTKRVVPILSGVLAKSAGKDIIIGTGSNLAVKPKIVRASADAFVDTLFVNKEA